MIKMQRRRSLFLVVALLISWLLLSSPSAHGMALNDGEKGEKEQLGVRRCTIRVQKVDEYKGKCTRLGDGSGKMACQTELYLDPNNEDCAAAAPRGEDDGEEEE